MPHKFPRRIIVFSKMSQFSDPEGQRFESSRSHQEQRCLGAALFILYEIVWDIARGGSNSCKGDRRLRRSDKARFLPRRQDRLFGDRIQRFALRWTFRSLPLRGKAAVAEGKPRPRGAARCGHRNPYSARRLRPGGQKQSCGLFLGRGRFIFCTPQT